MEEVARTATPTEQEKETRWTDDRIRWSDCEDEDEDDESRSAENASFTLMDPFSDPDPTQTFDFSFEDPNDADGSSVTLRIHGYKHEADAVWKSTGVTLWRAAEHLARFTVERAGLLRGRRVLELGAGLGLNGILAHRLGASHAYVTDGDSNAVRHLRQNIRDNRRTSDADDDASHVCGRQLLWGRDTSEAFLDQCGGNRFDVLLASDIVYSPVIVPPLWETVQVLLDEADGVFVMAFARREGLKVTLEDVLHSAAAAGFSHERVDGRDVEGIFVYEFRWSGAASARKSSKSP